ncbi:MAG: hypothetical protein R2706_20040, partial [Acidimicrobiales bacterium]
MSAIAPASGQRTPGLDETLERLATLTAEFDTAEAELYEAEQAVARATYEADAIRSERAEAAAAVQELAITSFTRGDLVRNPFEIESLTDLMVGMTLGDAATGTSQDSLDAYRAVLEDAALLDQTLAARLAEQEVLVA